MKKRILLVDDEISILKVTHTVLEKAGYEVVTCYYPEEAIYHLENEIFDLMITDLKLNHRLDGLDLVREAQRLRRNMPT
ncbi:MAG: response regulator, partial [Lentisphaeria bacterium]